MYEQSYTRFLFFLGYIYHILSCMYYVDHYNKSATPTWMAVPQTTSTYGYQPLV